MTLNATAVVRERADISAALTVLLGAACGLIVANLYFAQPLAGPIGAALGLSREATGLIVTLTQLGYGVGLLLIVPLADIVENRRLVVACIVLSCLGLVAAALSSTADMFLAASCVIGLTCVAAQIIVPYAASMVSDEHRGRVVGNVMSGLVIGIMLARPVSSFIAEIASWRLVYVLSAGVMLALALTLRLILPVRRPAAGLSYLGLLGSMGHLVATTPVLRRRALYQVALFGVFSLFWTTVPLLLAAEPFHMSQARIGLFALAGVAGAIAAPLAGRVADAGYSRPASIAATLTVVAGFGMSCLRLDGSVLSIALLTLAAILIDFGTTANLTLGQRAIFALPAELRGRLNGLFIAAFFLGGAAGSAVGGWAYATGGWSLAAVFGLAPPFLAFLYALTDVADA
jgi:predicted MFS family arabinose efflux permease